MTETLTCPILKTGPFKDPVTIGSGITFERSAILDWFAKETEDQGPFAEHRCPSTRKIVEPSDIQPNVIVKQIQEKHRRDFKKDYPTKFSTPLDSSSMPYVRTPAIRLEEGESVGGVETRPCPTRQSALLDPEAAGGWLLEALACLVRRVLTPLFEAA